MRFFVKLLLVLVVSVSPAAAEEYRPVETGPEVKELLDALDRQDRESAISKIKGIFALADDDRFVRTPSAFVDLVIGCPSTQIGANIGTVFKLYTYRWDCPNGQYQAELGKDPESTYVEVVDPADEAHLAKREATRSSVPMMIPPPPTPLESTEEIKARMERRGIAELAVLKMLEPLLKAGGLTDEFALAQRANFQTGYRDYAQNTFIAEMDGDGLEAANKQLAWMTENLGRPASAECRQERSEIRAHGYITFFSNCTVKSSRPGHGYTAIVFFRDAKVSSIQFNYMNREVFERNRDYLTSRARGN